MTQKRLWKWLFALYGALMLWLLFGRSGAVEGLTYWEQVAMSYNLTPLHTVIKYIRLLDSQNPGLVRTAVINLFGNVIMFVPLGFLLPRVFPKLGKLWKTLAATTVIIILVELAQLFSLMGSCDVDDLILNVLGSAVGYGIHRIFTKK